MRPSLGALMLVAVALVAALAAWDEARESTAALEEFASEQAALARVTSSGLAAQLEVIRRDALTLADDAAHGRPTSRAIEGSYVGVRAEPATSIARASNAAPPGDDAMGVPLAVVTPDDARVLLRVPRARLLAGGERLERPDERLVLLLAPGAARFRTLDGRDVAAPALRDALGAGRSALRLGRADAAALGLPARMAMAGLANVDGGALGRWGVAVVTSARRERDREQRARWRVVLGVLLAAGLVGGFGSVALAAERRRFALAQRLAASDRERTREAVLEREGRAATLLTLAAGVAHEVSTPLGVIAGRAEQLAERFPPEDARAAKCVAAILAQTQRIREVIHGLLHVARGGDPVLEPIDLGAVDAATATLVRHRFEAAEVALVLDAAIDPRAAPGVRGDPRLLEHALVNLVLNACDACARGGRVVLSTRAEPGRVVLVVDDDGAGIDPAHAARIGEPFFSTKPRDRGTGLGLAVATEIVRIHRGELALAPHAPRGTRATITLPSTPEDTADAAA